MEISCKTWVDISLSVAHLDKYIAVVLQYSDLDLGNSLSQVPAIYLFIFMCENLKIPVNDILGQ